MSKGRRGILIVAVAVAVAFALAACGEPQDSADPSSPAEVTLEPTPSATPIDVAAVFVEELSAMTSLASTLSGGVAVGDVTGEISGHLRVAGPDRHNLTVVTFPGRTPREDEQIVVGGLHYQRLPSGIWVRSSLRPGEGMDPISAALEDADALEVVGTEEHDGVTLQRLESSDPADISPEDLGFSGPTISDFAADIAFLANDDGTPAGIVIEATWTQGADDAREPAEFEMIVTFTDDEAFTIEAPPDPWTVHESAELGYRMAYPADWDVAHQPATGEFNAADIFVGPTDGEVQVYLYEEFGEPLPNEWFRASADLLADRFGSQPELVDERTLENGLRVQVFSLDVVEAGDAYHFQEAVVFGDGEAWDLDWYAQPGNEAEDLELLLNFVNSFTPSE